ncbi:MAG: class I SAM-dependent methyltransferase [candidate division KSB1 bacterium]|nr:class I SAM-dependent methyltransferase [candidate division KSB1 bacterium]
MRRDDDLTGSTTASRTHWDAFWSGKRPVEEIYETGDRIVRALTQVVDPRGKWVLEVGAGSGRDSVRLARLGARAVALDYSTNSVRTVKRLADAEGVKVWVVRADALRLPFRRGTFDVVFHQGLLEHFRDPIPLLQANVEVLRAGGYLVVDVPQKYHPYTLVKHLLMKMGRWFAGWETEFTVAELKDLICRVGLVPVLQYGDWMHPSLAYRGLRLALLRFGVRLPMYPRGIPVVRAVRGKLRSWAKSKRWSFWTFLDIGVIARYPEGGEAVVGQQVAGADRSSPGSA